MAGTLQLGYKGKGKVHLYKPQSCICHYSGAVHHRQAGVQCRLQLKPTLRLWREAIQPHEAIVFHFNGMYHSITERGAMEG